MTASTALKHLLRKPSHLSVTEKEQALTLDIASPPESRCLEASVQTFCKSALLHETLPLEVSSPYLRELVCRGVQASSPMRSRSMAVHCCIMRVTPLACSTWLPAALPGPPCSALLPK